MSKKSSTLSVNPISKQTYFLLRFSDREMYDIAKEIVHNKCHTNYLKIRAHDLFICTGSFLSLGFTDTLITGVLAIGT